MQSENLNIEEPSGLGDGEWTKYQLLLVVLFRAVTKSGQNYLRAIHESPPPYFIKLSLLNTKFCWPRQKPAARREGGGRSPGPLQPRYGDRVDERLDGFAGAAGCLH
jgi:hypothetical protein